MSYRLSSIVYLEYLEYLELGVWGSCRNALKIDWSIFEGIPPQELGDS